MQGPLHSPLESPEQLVSWWITTLIDILPESCCSILHVTRTFVASNFCCAESVSQLPTNGYNLDEAVALKVGFVLYILPQILEIVLVSVV